MVEEVEKQFSVDDAIKAYSRGEVSAKYVIYLVTVECDTVLDADSQIYLMEKLQKGRITYDQYVKLYSLAHQKYQRNQE